MYVCMFHQKTFLTSITVLLSLVCYTFVSHTHNHDVVTTFQFNFKTIINLFIYQQIGIRACVQSFDSSYVLHSYLIKATHHLSLNKIQLIWGRQGDSKEETVTTVGSKAISSTMARLTKGTNMLHSFAKL